MVRAVEQIEQEIAALDQTVAALAQTFHESYQQYLTALGQATRQQLVLAGYHLCTHGYPEQFLKLSLQQKQELQQALRQLAKQAQPDLLERLQPIQPAESPPIRVVIDRSTKEQLNVEVDAESDAEDEAEAGATTFQLIVDESQLADMSSEVQASMEEISVSLDAFSQSLFEELSSPPEQSSRSDHLHPKDILYWHTKLENRIAEVLQNLSHTANRVLQQANILPSRLPEPVLEVAAKADLAAETVASPPNLLNLLIDSGERSAMTQVMAIRLRLSEIEFSDATAAAHRSRLRQLMVQLTKLGRDYQRKQKECAVAQAEAAWRSSWFEPEE